MISLSLISSIVDICICKSKRTTRNKESSMMTANTATKKQNDSDLLILFALTESIRSHKNKRTNTKNDKNKQNGIPIHIYAIGRQRL